MIPARHALIGAFTNRDFRISHINRLVVLDGREWSDGRPNRDWEACDLTHGACFTAWMQGDRTMTPEFVFSEFAVFYGFADSAVMEQAIAAFVEIEECGWARAMVPAEPTRKPTWRLEDVAQ